MATSSVSSSTSTTASGIPNPVFTAGGLATGMDTNSIVSSLVAIESQPITAEQTKQAAFQTQISTLADLTTKLQALQTATSALGTGGVLGVSQVGSTSGFSTTPASGASPGTYSVQVTGLASPAKAMSASFATGATVTGGTLTLSNNGTSTDITIADGASLSDVASSINQSSSGVLATVLTTNGQSYLSLTTQNTGFTVGQDPSTALTISETTTGTQGQSLGLAVTKQATNASLTVDGLSFERQSNSISDVLPGTTLNLSQVTSAPETLVLGTDSTSTQANLQKFVDAYNTLITALNAQLSPPAGTTGTLAADPALRQLQSSMGNLISGVLSPNAQVRTLADLGVSTAEDGTLSIKSSVLSNALANNPQAVNSLFSTASTGLSDAVQTLATEFTDPVTGFFTQETSSLNDSVQNSTQTVTRLQANVDAYQQTLLAEFSAMESTVANFKSISDYLNQQESANTSSTSTSIA
jgi:flagellar hook-associated protein 2